MPQASLGGRCMIISELEKILPGVEPRKLDDSTLVRAAFAGERVALQVAFQAPEYSGYDRTQCTVRVLSDVGDAQVYLTRLVPCELPSFPDYDDQYLLRHPGLLPDLLESVGATADVQTVKFLPDRWQSIWVEISVPEDVEHGRHTITVEFRTAEGELHAHTTAELDIIDAGASLGNAPSFAHSQWLHVDSLAHAYGVDIWSERHWQIVEHYVHTMTQHSINTLFTPLFTPPVDIRKGGSRDLAQLVRIREVDGVFEFDFALLHRWIDLAERAGIETLEMAPLFTQWGATHAPTIAVEDQAGTLDPARFGWHTEATSGDYRRFLDALLPQLISLLRKRGWHDRCFFHISDEPDAASADDYQTARELVARHVGDIPIRDASSATELFRAGVLTSPIAGIDAAEQFIAAGAKDLWIYTSVAHRQKYSNTYIALPASRSRMIGVQLFQAGVIGYLRWGFNFWSTQYSARAIDPYRITDADGAFPAGDPFLVYPGADDRPALSMRLKYLAQASDDYRLLGRLAGVVGLNATRELVDEIAGAPLTFTSYPQDLGFFNRLRTAILQRLQSEKQLIGAPMTPEFGRTTEYQSIATKEMHQ